MPGHAGLRNIYIADPLMIHDESKTREPDNTRERYIRYFSEADYTRRRFRDYFYDDPSYNPNLSVDKAGDLAEPPRVRRPWSRSADRPLRILLLSVVYKIGYGVPVVIQQHARKLAAVRLRSRHRRTARGKRNELSGLRTRGDRLREGSRHLCLHEQHRACRQPHTPVL